MRPVDKGTQTQSFQPYQNAKILLIEQIGDYCSYCEIQSNRLDVEHIVPKSKGGAIDQWENFLLACQHCNGSSNKGNKNDSRAGYFWCDQDNTFLAFLYQFNNTVIPNPQLTMLQQEIAQRQLI